MRYKWKCYLIVFLIGIFIPLTFEVYPYRPAKPARLFDLKQETQIVQLNESLENLWNVVMGRYSLDIVTVNPDGARKGDVGDMVLFNNSGTFYFAINTTGAKIWRSVQLTNTP